MRISSLAQLAARLDRSLAWRKKELTQFKLLTDSCPSPSNAKILRRSGVALLYAHWEGFVKDASNMYLAYLTNALADLGALKSCFVAIALRRQISLAGQAKRTSLGIRLVEYLRSLDSPPAKKGRIPRQAVSTRSNLKGVVLREIAATLGLDYSRFELKETPIINHLVELRNTIAHGGGVPIDLADYNSLHSDVIVLLDDYRDVIQDAADNDKHLR